MRIGIDGTPLTIPFYSGTRHYAEQLLSALAHLDNKNEYIIFIPGEYKFFYGNNFKIIPVPKNIPILKRQVFLQSAAKGKNLDIFHYLEPFGSYFFRHPRIITTVHDLDLGSIYPKVNSPRSFIRRWYPEVIRRGTFRNTHTFITVSEWAKKELQKYIHRYNLRSNVVVIYEAHSSAFRKLNNKYHRNTYFLCMGDFSPRKNIPRILEAFSEFQKLFKNSYRLKIVVSSPSPKKDFMKRIEELGITRYVDIVENASLHKLIELYNDAVAFVYPSLYEGFGIPILEAMACGCPVITSDRGAMKEIAADAAHLVDPTTDDDIVQAMRKILTIPRYQSLLRRKGHARAKQFSWKTTAMKTFEVYKKVFRS